MIETPTSKIEQLLLVQNDILTALVRDVRSIRDHNRRNENQATTGGATTKATWVIAQILSNKSHGFKYVPLEEFYGTIEDATQRALKIQKLGPAAQAPAKIFSVQEYFDMQHASNENRNEMFFNQKEQTDVPQSEKAPVSQRDEAAAILKLLEAILGPVPLQNKSSKPFFGDIG